MSKSKRQTQRLWLLGAFIVLIYGASHYQPDNTDEVAQQTSPIAELFQQKRSDVLVEVSGEVSRLFADDNRGSRHQRFLIELADGHTLLIAHNIDLAPRVENLEIGDEISLFGEYEWNDKGGVVHWTHHDPANKHPHGWIRHQGKLYQ
ncbi:hypothetical protein LP43_1905 [Methylophaga thiooxydans]|uniref:DUF3465 domain-containing protein n=1 Tax=Methylophaga thiooxydans TaxID=392484 RepID=A0A0A0BFG8_9GAMM|nr:DUF3465 domain-containing protein [Methylophaga thiooxydans]KGM06681.1 hypothetical protein LP43_1905 [Methylophaga thiooxydans]